MTDVGGSADAAREGGGPPPLRGTDVDAVVVGAGFAGMYSIHRMRGMGYRVVAFEAASDVGGTWWWNRYPGARCDVESMDYSYSFDEDLEQEWEWTERYPTQPEILCYASHVADRFDLRRDIRFDTKVTAARWDDERQRWHVTTDRGDEVSARFCIMAVGPLSAMKEPDIEGIDRFGGETYYTGRWPHGGADFTGKRVGIVGTGSSGIQAIPLIAEQATHLTVFQRTPNFSQPAHNGPIDPEHVAERKANYREYRQRVWNSRSGFLVERPVKAALDATPEERETAYRNGWKSGLLYGMHSTFTDLMLDEEANDTVAEFVRQRIREIVRDPEVAEKLCPKNHPFGTKRPCLDTNYYETYNRDNVTLVDLRATPIEGLTATGVRTTAEHHEVDAMVFATGFDAMTGPLLRPEITGIGGISLRDKWAEGPQTYLGLATAGFPNMFVIVGPQSPSVLVNMIMAIEQHVDWIADCIAYLDEHGYGAIDADPDDERAWVRRVEQYAAPTLYPKANSWWMGANVPGKPRTFLMFIGGFDVYRQICDEVAANGYQGFNLSPATTPVAAR